MANVTIRGQHNEDNLTRIFTQLLTLEVISTLRFRRGEQPQRRRSGGCSPSPANPCSAPQGIECLTQSFGFLAMSLQAQRQTQPLIDFGHERPLSLAQHT
jgi:hypothetical protein